MIRTDVLAEGYRFREFFVLSLYHPSVPTYLAYILQIFLPIRSNRDNAGFRSLIENKKNYDNGS